MVINTTAGTHPIQNDYSHGSRFPCQKNYIHGCRASSIKVLFTRQPFLIPKKLYTRLPCIKYKNAIYTAAVSHAKWFLHTAAVHPVYKRYLHGIRFQWKTYYKHCCCASSMKWIHVFTRQSFIKQKNMRLWSFISVLAKLIWWRSTWCCYMYICTKARCENCSWHLETSGNRVWNMSGTKKAAYHSCPGRSRI